MKSFFLKYKENIERQNDEDDYDCDQIKFTIMFIVHDPDRSL